jgi:hypothetical protein
METGQDPLEVPTQTCPQNQVLEAVLVVMLQIGQAPVAKLHLAPVAAMLVTSATSLALVAAILVAVTLVGMMLKARDQVLRSMTMIVVQSTPATKAALARKQIRCKQRMLIIRLQSQ